MNLSQKNFNYVKLSNLQNKDGMEKQIQKVVKPKAQNIEGPRRTSYRQFGVDITNNQEYNNKFVNKKEVVQKKSLSKKGSVSSKKISNKIDLAPKKNIKGVSGFSLDDSAKNLKNEINNSFDGSTMIVDDGILTRNQISDRLYNNNPQLVLEYLEEILRDFYNTEYNPNNMTFYPSQII